MLEVTIISPERIVFKGGANSVIFPGEAGVFEVLPFHKRLMSLLRKGEIEVDKQSFFISQGVVKVDRNKVTVLVTQD